MPNIAIPVDSKIIGEMFLRAGPNADISDWVENIVRDYLERTADDEWSDAYYAYRESQVGAKDFAAEFFHRLIPHWLMVMAKGIEHRA